MLKIGEFSKIAQLPVKTLRYYAERGLLKPAWIDRFSGYRYYTLAQLPRLNRILALKDLGFSLDQIEHLLYTDMHSDELRGMLRMRHAELEQHIHAEQSRLTRIEARLQQIEREELQPTYEVVLKPVATQRILGIRDTLSSYSEIDTLFSELDNYLQHHRHTPVPVNPYLGIHYDGEYRDEQVDLEVAVPLARQMPGSARAFVHELPSSPTMACVVHQGDYTRLNEASQALVGWIDANGYRITGMSRHIFLQRPLAQQQLAQPSNANPITELQYPVKMKPFLIQVKGLKEKIKMEPTINKKEAFTVVGMLYHGKNENSEIAKMWREFHPRMEEIQDKVDPNVGYGVCGELEKSGAFKYLAGSGVTQATDIPEGMSVWEVPEQLYAVFPCTLSTIGDAYQFAFDTWLPESDYAKATGPDFEFYPAEFNGDDAEAVMYIYIPIK
ncbi:MAG: GyrI-like domain-containing protein [Anaerolineales bacterium]|nr:GyrI-like domain-containing protein [Anaerolineales bacterium]